MPVVNIQMFAGRSENQKKELARAITEAVVNIAKTTAEETVIIFHDIERNNWAKAGVTASDW